MTRDHLEPEDIQLYRNSDAQLKYRVFQKLIGVSTSLCTPLPSFASFKLITVEQTKTYSKTAQAMYSCLMKNAESGRWLLPPTSGMTTSDS